MNVFADAINNVSTTIRTENGDKTYSTSLDANVDMFFKIAAIRGRGVQTAVNLFQKAYAEDMELATRILLWSRDAREGAGERQIFRDLLLHLEKVDTDLAERVAMRIPELGRWDDLLIFQTPRMKILAVRLFADALKAGNGLAAKWMPREHNKKLRWFRDAVRIEMGMDNIGHFRRTISYLSNTIEQQMCENDWENIDFSKIPSKASAIYSKAFWKRQPERYGEFVQKAVKGEVKINTGALFPYDVTRNRVDEQTQNALWKQLPDLIPADVSIIPIVDTSGSMSWTAISQGLYPRDVALSLGLYIAEHNKSAFKNIVMPFADHAEFVRIPTTDSLRQKLNTIERMYVGGSTNLDAAFDLILQTAIDNRVPQADMPQFLLIFSDMEFNGHLIGQRYGQKATSVAERSKAKFENAGYKLPTVVWWNIQARGDTTPVRYDESGMVLVSGASPNVVKSILSGDINPRKAMLNTVMIDRYDF